MDRNKTYPWYFALGALLLFFILCFIPSVIGVFYSFTDWNSFSDKVNFVGLDNFKTIFISDKSYLTFIGNTVYFTVFTTALKTIIGLIFALLFTRGIKFANFHRMVIFSPQVLSYLIVGLVFKGMLHPSSGFLNIFLDKIGLDFLANDWLGSIKYAFPSVMLVDTWKGVGYGMVIFIAGIQGIPESYYEAASLDGAGFIQKTFKITLPLLMPTLIMTTVLNVTYGLRVFDIIYVLTNGGPGYATDVMNTAVFKEFSRGNYAVGTALSTLLAVFTMAISYFILKALNKKEEY
jgi:raffinose/stachyose/melibiose transport system permease protein